VSVQRYRNHLLGPVLAGRGSRDVRGTQRIMVVLAAGLLAGASTRLPAYSATGAKHKKKVTACKLMTVDQIDAIVAGEPVGRPNASSVPQGSVCDYDIGEGIGTPGGGSIVVQVHTGTVGKNIFNAAKKNEAVGSVYWNPETTIATGRSHGATVSVAVSVMGTSGADHRDEAVALVTRALKKA
jgi:hypothetical protein